MENKPSVKKGVVQEPLIDAIPIQNIIFSLLYAEIGVGNKLLDSFFEWVDYRVESLSIEEMDARDKYQSVIVDHKEVIE